MIGKVPKTIVVDFDGTICEMDWPNIGPLKRGAKEALQYFRQLGYKVIISSCRTCSHCKEIFNPDGITGKYSKYHLAMKDWLDANGVPYDEIDDGTRGKPIADYYLDDKAIHIDDNWAQVAEFIGGRDFLF